MENLKDYLRLTLEWIEARQKPEYAEEEDSWYDKLDEAWNKLSADEYEVSHLSSKVRIALAKEDEND